MKPKSTVTVYTSDLANILIDNNFNLIGIRNYRNKSGRLVFLFTEENDILNFIKEHSKAKQ